MKHLSGILLLVVLHLSAYDAEAIRLTVVAEDVKGRPVKDVVFNSLSTGEVSAPTTNEGRTEVSVKVGLKPGENAELKVSRIRDRQPDWGFIDPWNGWVRLPALGDYAKVVLARRKDREALESAAGAKAMAQRINAEINKATALQKQQVTDEQRRNILTQEAVHVGLKPEEVDHAIRSWKEHTRDPHDIGIAVFYERNYPKATMEREGEPGQSSERTKRRRSIKR